MKIVHRVRAMPSYVRAGIRKCARIRALPCDVVSSRYQPRFLNVGISYGYYCGMASHEISHAPPRRASVSSWYHRELE